MQYRVPVKDLSKVNYLEFNSLHSPEVYVLSISTLFTIEKFTVQFYEAKLPFSEECVSI